MRSLTARCECGGSKTRKARACDGCNAIERQRHAAESVTDRVAERMKRLDEWVMATDIADAIEESRAHVSSSLSNLERRGVVESRRRSGVGVVYRLMRAA